MAIKGKKYRQLQTELGVNLEEHLKKRYETGIASRELADELNVSQNTLYYWLKQLSIIRTKSEANKIAWERGRWDREAQSRRVYDTGFNKYPLGKPSPRKDRPLNVEWRDKISLGLIGLRKRERHPCWRGGIAAKNYSDYWSRNKRLTRERAEFKCERCGVSEEEIGRKLDVHHKIPFKKFATPAQANNLNNLMALCRKCHMALEPD